ncbi:hypothetical protein VTP01DRAFT_2570 [Rhizomucor pusillus]|uniref:uncharacterized protein n=1 Tax=Rhizomucor pusillus TaxID=4840 RepID=UPI0037437A4C
MDEADIQQDSGRYLQEYVQSLENLPSEIKYHWAEVLNRDEIAQGLEKRVHMNENDLAKLHKQWFQPELEKREKILKHEPALIRRIHRDYDKLEDLATERIQLMEGALKLVDRHLSRLGSDLDQIDRPSSSSSSSTAQQQQRQQPPATRTSLVTTKHDMYDENEMDEDEAYFDTVSRRRKRKERDENDEEPLYCYCRQVSYGEMVGCDGENCPYEWFHMECVGLDAPPKGAWYCDDCLAEAATRRQYGRSRA